MQYVDLGEEIVERRPPHGGRGLKYVGTVQLRQAVESRPPHGGRGLKYILHTLKCLTLVALPTEGVD